MTRVFVRMRVVPAAYSPATLTGRTKGDLQEARMTYNGRPLHQFFSKADIFTHDEINSDPSPI